MNINYLHIIWSSEKERIKKNNLQFGKYMVTILVLQARNWARVGGRGRSPLPFLKNRKKCPYFGKNGPNCVHPCVKSSIQNVVLRVSRRKSSEIFPCGAFFFLRFWRKVYRSALIPSLHWQISGCASLLLIILSFHFLSIHS